MKFLENYDQSLCNGMSQVVSFLYQKMLYISLRMGVTKIPQKKFIPILCEDFNQSTWLYSI